MTQEQFEALGIEKSIAKKAAEESKKELDGYVTKETYDQTEQQRKQLETTANDYKSQLETLKTTAGDNAALTQQIADFQQQIADKEKEHQKEITDLKLTNAIKLILGDDGKVSGLDEQVKSLKESKPFLFKAEQKPAAKKGFFPLGAKEPGEGGGTEGRMTMKEAIAAKLGMNEKGD